MGYRISFEYLRTAPTKVCKKGHPIGVACAVEVDSIEDVYIGYSYCHPKDQFNKITGRKMALTRAIEDLPREERREIWEVYHGSGRSIPSDR